MKKAVATLLAPGLLGGLLAGCASAPPLEPIRPNMPVAADYAADYRPPAGEDELWWRGFGDPALDALVDKALADNLSVEAARARLASALALLDAERADRLPRIDGFGDAAAVAELDDGGSDISLSAGLTGIFDTNLNGRLSREIELRLAQSRGATYQLADARRLVAAAVSQTYIEMRRGEERLALLDESTDLQERTLRIVTLRFEAGLSANLDVRRAAADLAQTRAQRGLIELSLADAANVLATLVGEQPGGVPPLSTGGRGIPAFVAGPPRGVPADLVRRRPDLLVAEADLAAASAAVGIEQADLYPSLVIPGQIGIDGLGAADIASSVLATIAAAIDLPLFDGGRRRAEIRSAEAAASASLAVYRQTLLDALAEVETSLVAIRAYQSRLADLALAIEESEAAYEQSNALYREGLTSLFEVLDVQRQLISSREAYVDAEAALAAAVVDMYRAVGAPSAIEPMAS